MLQGEEDNQLIYMDFVCANGHLTNSVPSSTENIKIALPPRHTFSHRYISLVEFTLWSCEQQLSGSWQEHGLVRTRYMKRAQVILVLLLRSAL